MQANDLLLTLLVGEKTTDDTLMIPEVEQLHQLAHDFAHRIAEWDEESPLDDIEALFTSKFQSVAQQLQHVLSEKNEQEEKRILSALADDALQWELLQYDDSVLSLLVGQSLPEGIADEKFNTLVRRYPEWALELADAMEDECTCGCCHDDHEHSDHHHKENGCHCHH